MVEWLNLLYYRKYRRSWTPALQYNGIRFSGQRHLWFKSSTRCCIETAKSVFVTAIWKPLCGTLCSIIVLYNKCRWRCSQCIKYCFLLAVLWIRPKLLPEAKSFKMAGQPENFGFRQAFRIYGSTPRWFEVYLLFFHCFSNCVLSSTA